MNRQNTERETDCSPLSSAEVTNVWSFTSSSTQVFTVWRLSTSTALLYTFIILHIY
jgi:hypothetical protein